MSVTDPPAGSEEIQRRRELVDRVESSLALQKSVRLRELFRFLCDRALDHPDRPVHEQDIGVEIFGREEGYDTTQDNLVRVQVCQLRKKLQQYFEVQGKQEPVVIEIPKGAYTPAFRTRASEPAVDPPAKPPLPARSEWSRRTVGIGLFALAGWCAFLLTAYDGPSSGLESRPTVDRLWRQMFANELPSCIVLSDANLTLVEDMIRRELYLSEYRGRGFDRLTDDSLQDPDQKEIARTLLSKPFTHIADAHLAGVFEVLNAAHHIRSHTVFARDFGEAYLQAENVILMGTRRANPWMDVVEKELNFRSGVQNEPLATYFENRSPRPGESPTYRVDWGRTGYCRVAWLPNLSRTGSILVISGTDMASSEAGGQFISTETWVKQLQSALAVKENNPFPHFEVLLKVDYLVATALKFQIVAHRAL